MPDRTWSLCALAAACAETIDGVATLALTRATVWPRAIPSSRTLASINRKGVATSHAEGTPNLLTGRYLAYRNARKLESDRLEPTGPALFKYLRRSFAIPSPEVLLVNGDDRPQEAFFIFGAGDHFGGRLPV